MFKKIFVFIIKLLTKMKEDNIFAFGAQFSYYILLGIFPFLMLSISILCSYSYYIFDILNTVETILPQDVYEIVYSIVTKSVNNCSKTNFSSSILVVLWSATAGSASIIHGINRAYGFTVKNNYLFMRIEGIIFSVAIMLLLQVIFAFIVLGREIVLFLEKINLFSDATYWIIDLFRYALPIILLFLVFSAAYKFLTYEKVSFSFVLPGAIASTIGFVLGSMIFSNYISTKAKYYNSIYGNLSGLIVFLIWIFILSVIFLTGAEINYFIGKYSQKQKK